LGRRLKKQNSDDFVLYIELKEVGSLPRHFRLELSVTKIEESQMICPNCQSSNEENAIVCRQCNQFLIQTPRRSPQIVVDTSTERVPSYLILSIFVTTCCCLPFGIAGIVHASRVNSQLAAGDIQGARMSSDSALKWSMIGLAFGVAFSIIYLMAGGASNLARP